MDAIRTETPESVALLYTPAGLGSRLAAALIDGAIQLGVGAGIAVLSVWTSVIAKEIGLELLGSTALALQILAAAGILFLYPLFFEAVWRGQTPGKRAMGLRVTRADGLPADFGRLAVRNLLRVVDFIPSFYAAGMLAVLFTRRAQRLGDLAAGTMVVREQPAALPAIPPAPQGPLETAAATLRPQLLRIPDAALEPVRAFWSRRESLAPGPRRVLAQELAAAVAKRCGWTEPIPNPETFLKEVLLVLHGETGTP